MTLSRSIHVSTNGEDPSESLNCKEIKLQSILKESNPQYSLEGLMLKLKLQYFGHLIRRADTLKRPWCYERLRARGDGDRGWDSWWHHRLNGNESEQTPGDSEGEGSLVCCMQSMGLQRVRHDWVTEQQQRHLSCPQRKPPLKSPFLWGFRELPGWWTQGAGMVVGLEGAQQLCKSTSPPKCFALCIIFLPFDCSWVVSFIINW